MQTRIAIACGDPLGIGPEVTLKALAQPALLSEASTRWFLHGNYHQLGSLNASLKLGLSLTRGTMRSLERWVVVDDSPPNSALPSWDRLSAARSAMSWLEAGARACLGHEADALVTAPVSKESIIDAGYQDFVGQTEFLSQLAGSDRTVMMLLGADDRGRWLRVALATVHIPLRRVADALSADRIELAIVRAAEACRDLGLAQARVGVCGLNPHAGEGGKIGREEIDLIGPAVRRVRDQGVNVAGPLPADTLFHQAFRGDFDAVVAMYHDQGLAPLKMIGFETGINWSLGLPIIRTSPDHGTAFDLAGKGLAHSGSMLSALQLADKLARAKNVR